MAGILGSVRRRFLGRRHDERFSSEALPDVEASEWWSREQIAEYQARRLRWMIEYAWDEIPFYRELMRRRGLRPSTVQGPDDLPAIPPVNRALIQQNHDRVMNEREVHEYALSGGTTGHRLRWARTVPWLELFTACLWRGFGWAGVSPDTRLVTFYSRRIRGVSPNNLILPGAMDVSRVEEDLERIRGFAPEAAYTYASVAFVVARYLLRTGRTLPLDSYITSQEVLHAEYRPVIAAAFECEVYDNYGCNDGGAWGAECPEHLGLHHDVERAIIEFDEGRMIATDLWNTAFPFIRYETGDAGHWLEDGCPCGRASPRFHIVGREADLLVTPTRVIFPSLINGVLLHDGLSDARVIQHSDLDVQVLLVRNERLSDQDYISIVHQVRDLFAGMKVSFEFVDSIPLSESGKHRVGVNLSGTRPERLWDGGPSTSSGEPRP